MFAHVNKVSSELVGSEARIACPVSTYLVVAKIDHMDGSPIYSLSYSSFFFPYARLLEVISMINCLSYKEGTLNAHGIERPGFMVPIILHAARTSGRSSE